MKIIALLSFVVIGVTGCAGHIETVKIDPNTMQVLGGGVGGVVYYEPRLVKLTYEFTQLLDKDKELIGSAENGTCKKIIQKEEIVTLPDYQSPRAVLYKPSWFSSNEFGVTLNSGMLVSVTSKATPQLPQLLEQVTKAKDAGVFFVAPTTCNAGPAITKQEVIKL